MPGLTGWLFGSDALKKAGGDAPKATDAPQPAGLDMAGLAQDAANRAKAQESASKQSKGGSPLSTTMTPISKKATTK